MKKFQIYLNNPKSSTKYKLNVVEVWQESSCARAWGRESDVLASRLLCQVLSAKTPIEFDYSRLGLSISTTY